MLLPLLWAACLIAALIYAAQQHIPIPTVLAVLPAFLLEATFFCALASDRIRARLEKRRPAGVALLLIIAAVAPYSAAYLGLGGFHWRAFCWIAGLAAVASFWFVLLPPAPASDIFFLVFMAVVWVSRILHPFYAHTSRIPTEALLQLMWFRTGLFAMLTIRRVQNVGFGFWPEKREWKIGAIWFVIFLPAAATVGWWVGFVGKPRVGGWERTSLLAIGTFFGALWVLALGEEFFFRGLLQQWMTRWLASEWAGLLAASAVFGASHLWFRAAFPNWRIAALATILGICCGLAFRQARSIRASMVTHALAVTAWRVFFG